MNARVAPATESEASKMLEAALQQMDGIISNSTAHSSGIASSAQISNERCGISAANVLSTAKTLALALRQVGCNAPSPDPATSAVIIDWLETHLPRQDTDERLRRLQRDKESIALQYQNLVDHVSEQSNKIIELEKRLTEKTQQLNATEEMLQRQMLSRSALETQKLELISALSELKLHRAALERENGELKSNSNSTSSSSNGTDGYGAILKRLPFGSVGNLAQMCVGSNNSSSTSSHAAAPKTPPASLRHQVHPQFYSLPRSHSALNNKNNNSRTQTNETDNNANCNNQQIKQRNVAFADAEKIVIDDMSGSFISQNNSISSPSNNKEKSSSKGLRNIFGKLRRSNSGNFEIPTADGQEFKRGGSRATTSGRIEWTLQCLPPSKPYSDWSINDICNWLCDMGLGCYEEDCRKWLKNNPTIRFFDVSPVDIEKELNFKSPLHRKKIVLAIGEVSGKENDELALKAGQLDVSWVMRWLDDIGLPQYKDTFLMAKIDGRMLHRLTLEDLSQLHVTSCLHIISIRRGIQCMRDMQWNPECLIRRSIKKYETVYSSNEQQQQQQQQQQHQLPDEDEENINEEVYLWTAHRVMEWLRVVDLSEYAPNLRGAGVHGALMLFEPKFTANLLADLLSIPPSKTLLRRHLATHFKELLGRDIIQGKRDAENSPGYQPLTITAKIKQQKKSQFSLKRRKSTKGSDIEWTDYVCPMTTSIAENPNNISTTTIDNATNSN